jgi:murein DD-endopeptidase MepM/ murein hydrolase activator NlpD
VERIGVGKPVGTHARRRTALSVLTALCLAIFGELLGLQLPTKADTHGNTDAYEAGASINLPWWGSQTETVTQRYGCTTVGYPEDPAPNWCPPPYNAGWHQGIDIGMPSAGLTIMAQVDGVVVDFKSSCLSSGCALGYLAIKVANGNIIYLLHGSPTSTYAHDGTLISIGAQIYTTGSNGQSSGPHLHFEVHTSVVGELSTYPNPGPGDDINPESWLGASGCPSPDPATATAASSGGTNESGYFNWYGRDHFLLPTTSTCITPE